MNVIEKAFAPALGSICWDVTYFSLTNLSFSLGQPRLIIAGKVSVPPDTSYPPDWPGVRRLVHVQGHWHFRLSYAYWRLTFGGHTVKSGTSSRGALCSALGCLNGQKLVDVDVNSDTGATRMDFDLGGLLEVRRMGRGSSREVMWTLSEPTGYLLSVKGDGTYDHVSGDRRPSVRGRKLDASIRRGK